MATRPLNKPTQQIADFLRDHCEFAWCAEGGHTLCTPATIDGLEGYAVRVKSRHMGRDGDSFEARVYLDAKPVMIVINAGDGGPNDYFPVKGQDRDAFRAAYDTYKEVARVAFGEGYEKEDLLTEWLMDVDSIRYK